MNTFERFYVFSYDSQTINLERLMKAIKTIVHVLAKEDQKLSGHMAFEVKSLRKPEKCRVNSSSEDEE